MGTLFLTPGAVSSQIKTSTMADEDAKRKEELNNSLKEYISEWRKTREKEEDELSKLKEKQAKRKEIRLEQEKKLRRRRSALRRLRLSVRRCLRPRRPKRLKWLTRRNPLLEEKSMMPARSSPRPRSSLRKRRRLPLG